MIIPAVVGIVGDELEGLPEFLDGRPSVSLLLEHDIQIVMHADLITLELEGRAIIRFRLRIPIFLLQFHAARQALPDLSVVR